MTRGDASRPAATDGETPLVARVFAKLADGSFHSGEDLAKILGVTRSAIWKAARSLRDLGVNLHAVRNRGYRLVAASEPLEATRIRERISRAVRDRIRTVEVAWSVSSTNTVLLERGNPPNGSCDVILAEYQTAGRGRRGRAWLAPPGGAICLSLSHRGMHFSATFRRACNQRFRTWAMRPNRQAVFTIHRALGSGLDEVLTYEMDEQRRMSRTQDFREGVAAFLEKREPVYKGK